MGRYMKKYSKPNVELVFFTVESILNLSVRDGEVVVPNQSFQEGTVEYDMYQEYHTAGGTMSKAFVFTW